MWILFLITVAFLGGPETKHPLLAYVSAADCNVEKERIWQDFDITYPVEEHPYYSFQCTEYPRSVRTLPKPGDEDEPEQPEDKQQYPRFPYD